MDLDKAKELPLPLKKFYKGEPLALGITQVFLGILTIAFAIVLCMIHDYLRNIEDEIMMMTLCCTGVPYIISGALSVAAAKNPKPSLVKGMLGMNVISAVAAAILIIIFSLITSITGGNYDHFCSSEVDAQICREIEVIPRKTVAGIETLLLIFGILEFGISITGAVFGCEAICSPSLNKTVVVIYQSPPPNAAEPPPADKEV